MGRWLDQFSYRAEHLVKIPKRGEPLTINQAMNRSRTKLGLDLPTWLSITFVNVETPRFREPIDPFLVLLAACAVSTAAWRLLLRGAPVRRRRRTSELAGDDAQLVKMVQRLA